MSNAQNFSEYLERWEHPESYAGFSPVGDFVIYTRNRDSTILENVNYRLILEELESLAKTLPEPQNGENWSYDFRASHRAVGWVETIIVRADAPAPIIELAESIVCALADYPIYCESAYSEAQCEEIAQYWERISMQERIDWCQEAGESIFAARYNDVPERVWDDMYQSELFY